MQKISQLIHGRKGQRPSSLFKSFGKRSLTWHITYVIILVVTLVSASSLIINLVVVSQENERQFVKKGDEYLEFLRESLVLPLWTFDDLGINKLGQAVLSNPIVNSLTITDKKGNILFQESKSVDASFMVKREKVTRQNTELGSIALGLTNKPYLKQQTQIINVGLITIVALILSILGIVTLSVRLLIRKPLNDFAKKLDDLAKGEFNQDSKYRQYVELKGILGNFNDMAETIKSRESSLVNSNRALRIEVQEREKAEGLLRESQSRLLEEVAEKERTLRKLIDSEEQFRAVVENAQDGIVITRNGAFVLANQFFCGLTGYSNEELVGQDISICLPSSELGKIESYLHKTLEDDSAGNEFETKLLHKNGALVEAEINAAQYTFRGEELIMTIVRDITARKQAKKEIQLNEERWQRILKNAVVGIGQINVAGQFLLANDKLAQIFGYGSKEEFLNSGMNLGDLYDSPQDKESCMEKMREQGTMEGAEVKLRKKDGTKIWVMITSRSIKHDEHGMIFESFFVDVTRRKEAEEELIRSERELGSILNNTPDIIYRLDQKERISFINEAISHYGYTQQELIGKDIVDLVHPDDRSKANKYLKERRTRDRRTKDFTLRLVDGKCGKNSSPNDSPANDRSYIMLLTAEGLYGSADDAPGEQAKYLGTQGIIRDITQRKKLESKLRQSQKMESIGTLAGGIAHDFNNVLAAILSNLEVAKLRHEKDLDVEKNLEEIYQAALRARDLVRHILTFSRQSEVVKKPLDISPIVKETTKFIRASVPATISISINIEKVLGNVLGDPTQIHQCVLNLCTNAAQAMPESGGTIKVSLSSKELLSAEVMGDGILESGSYLLLRVSDNGKGIRPEIMDRVFDPFFTTKPRGEGTGIGLSSTHGIVKEMGGAIQVESEVGKGTTFSILLPLIDKQATCEKSAAPEIVGGTEMIIIVDDEKAIASTLAELLEHLGYRTKYFLDPKEALAFFLANSSEVDLIITDHTMPGMTGLKLAEIIRNSDSNVPLVLTTGYRDGLTEENAKARGFSALLNKPLVFKDLAHHVRRALSEQTLSRG